MIYYLIQSTLVLTLLLIVYFLLLKNEKMFGVNRFYLILAVLFSLYFPALQIENTNSVIEPVITVMKVSEYNNPIASVPNLISNEIALPKAKASLLFQYLFLIYISICLIFISKYFFNLYKLIKWTKNKGPKVASLQTVYIDSCIKPFSFFKFFFINKSEFDNVKYNDSIILHEEAHSKQMHSLDILIVEFIKCFLWFNPLVWIYKKEITENHEYLADSYAAKKQNNTSKYLQNLIASIEKIQPIPLTSGFGYLLIKKRIKMLNKSNKSIMSNTTKITSSLIIAGSVLFISSFNLHQLPTNIIENEIITKDKNIPALLPIKKEAINKVSASFGMTIHPVNKMEKMHTGTDFIAPEGTSIMATANGEISFSGFSAGYGNHVIIKHNDTYQSLYAHLNSINVKQGKNVNAGEVIGIIGSTGQSLSTHLHYEVIENGTKVNPSQFFDF